MITLWQVSQTECSKKREKSTLWLHMQSPTNFPDIMGTEKCSEKSDCPKNLCTHKNKNLLGLEQLKKITNNVLPHTTLGGDDLLGFA